MSVTGRWGRAQGRGLASALGGARLLALASLVSCSAAARTAQTAFEPSASPAPSSDQGGIVSGAAGDPAAPDMPRAGRDAGQDTGGSAAVSCPAGLTERLSLSTIDLGRDVRYKAAGYQGFPFDEHVAFAPASDGTAYVAWVEDATGGVHVTPLGTDYLRRGPDIDTRSFEVGSLAAREDGFALLSLRDDPGEPLGNSGGRAVFFLRFRRGQEQFAVPLTGTRSLTSKQEPAARDFAAGYVYGRLQWNGAKYGVYFAIFTAQGDPHGVNDTPGDKLVYLDDSGRLLRGGWSWKCASNQGLRMWPEPDVYTPVCMSDGLPAPGVNLVIEDQAPVQLAAEAASHSFCGGQWGSIIKLADNSYVVGWLSREVAPSSPMTPLRRASDVAMLRLSSDRQPLGKKRWLIETPSFGETNLHFARYGTSRVLMVWDRIDNLRCGDADQTCFGRYAGTFARVMDADGNVLIRDTQIAAVPNGYDDLQTLADGSVAWAFVPDEGRDYSSPLASDQYGNVRVPPKRRIQVARLQYCE